jgi:hypothetical protein
MATAPTIGPAFLPPSKKGDRGGFAFDFLFLKIKSKSPLLPFFKGGKT